MGNREDWLGKHNETESHQGYLHVHMCPVRGPKHEPSCGGVLRVAKERRDITHVV